MKLQRSIPAALTGGQTASVSGCALEPGLLDGLMGWWESAKSGWSRFLQGGLVELPGDQTEAQGTVSSSGPCVEPGCTSYHGWLGVQPVSISCQSTEQESASDFHHVSVLRDESVQWMEAGPDKFIIDGTLGGGGHSECFLEAGARVLGIDRDPEALAHARQRLARFGDRFTTWQGNFAELRDNPEVRREEQASGLLLDLGVSSRQLDAAERGFSFRMEGPLDMRMGPSCETDAAEVVNTWSEDALIRLFREYGEEPQARRMVAAILKRRALQKFTTTTDLADLIERTVGRHGRIHPATRVFQAIRMEVNDELGSLERALEASVTCLKPGGRLLVITFHSLEDRIVKRFMQHHAKPFLDDPTWPEPRPNPDWHFRLPVRKAIAPSDTELRINPRARSAKLRVAERIDPNSPPK
jgi:16S rRNA (cytosine1402-N4)-methyltransferase